MAAHRNPNTTSLLTVRASRGPWHTQAACRGLTHLMYPERGQAADMEQAKALCGGCPVKAECLEYAIVNVERIGVWGGCSERERQRIRVARMRARQGNAA